MPELIDRDALLKDLRSDCSESEVCIVNRQPAVNRWIPCSERLPEIDRDVLVYYPYWKDNPIQVAHLEYDSMYFELSDGEYNLPVNAVTHWMLLPEPPEKECMNDE